jgi:hypothetical protein
MAVLLGACAACFPTFQSARVEPGFRVDAGVTYIADQTRDNSHQEADIMATITPAYGFGRRVEVGLPISVYWEHGLRPADHSDSRGIVPAPYAKIALLNRDSVNHLSLTLQSAFILPGSVALRYSRDLGAWEPQIGLAKIFSGGPAGDDPVVTRYQQARQSLIAGSIGATFDGPRRPAIEIGILRNTFADCEGFCHEPQSTVRHSYHDVFIGMRLGVVR